MLNYNELLNFPPWLLILLGISVACVVILIIIVITVYLGKLMNKDKTVEVKNNFSQNDYLQGVLTSDLSSGKTAEVLLKGPFGGRNVKPCRLYSEDVPFLPKGTKVVVIEVSSGVAYIIKQTTNFN